MIDAGGRYLGYYPNQIKERYPYQFRSYLSAILMTIYQPMQAAARLPQILCRRMFVKIITRICALKEGGYSESLQTFQVKCIGTRLLVQVQAV